MAREEITSLAQQIKDLQAQAPVVPATTIFNKPKGRELVQTMPASSMPSTASSVASRDLASSHHALDMPGLTQQHCGCKPLLDITKIEVMDFPASIPDCAELGQMLFMLLIAIPGPPAQYPVVVVAKDPCTLVQYDGLVATQQKEAAASKGKGKAMLSDNESDYRKEESEQEHNLEESKTPHKMLQQVAWNKCIAKKKANIAAAHAAQV
ncbi:hypothetical protein C0993_004503 [Termitomyces sp. T159_Od127]|nr:hypothetical protein C0993_004503 [Termitomyces sp. T159_Od127]